MTNHRKVGHDRDGAWSSEQGFVIEPCSRTDRERNFNFLDRTKVVDPDLKFLGKETFQRFSSFGTEPGAGAGRPLRFVQVRYTGQGFVKAS